MADLEGKGSWPPSPKAEVPCYLPAGHRPNWVSDRGLLFRPFFLMSMGSTLSTKPQASQGSG